MLYLVTGGSGSGKSAYAEQLAVSLGEPRVYLAAMQPFGKEASQRIERHRLMRSTKGFNTVECYHDIQNLELDHPVLLLECMSNLTANEMFGDDTRQTESVNSDQENQRLTDKILSGVDHLLHQCQHVVVVTNEIFSDGIEYDETTMRYQRVLAMINQKLADRADEVIEVVCGIPIRNTCERTERKDRTWAG